MQGPQPGVKCPTNCESWSGSIRFVRFFNIRLWTIGEKKGMKGREGGGGGSHSMKIGILENKKRKGREKKGGVVKCLSRFELPTFGLGIPCLNHDTNFFQAFFVWKTWNSCSPPPPPPHKGLLLVFQLTLLYSPAPKVSV